jgi:hypothetical protein
MSFIVKYCFMKHLIHIKFEFLLYFALTSICCILYWKFHHLQFVAQPRTLIIYLSLTELEYDYIHTYMFIPPIQCSKIAYEYGIRQGVHKT